MPSKRKSRKRQKSNRKSKFERCVLQVKAKQKSYCKASSYTRKGCYNPWAVCHASINRNK